MMPAELTRSAKFKNRSNRSIGQQWKRDSATTANQSCFGTRLGMQFLVTSAEARDREVLGIQLSSATRRAELRDHHGPLDFGCWRDQFN